MFQSVRLYECYSELLTRLSRPSCSAYSCSSMCLITSHPLTLSLAAFSSPLWEPLTHSLQGLLSNSRTRWQETGRLEIGKGKRQICVSVAFPGGDAVCAETPEEHEPRISSPCLVPAGPPFLSSFCLSHASFLTATSSSFCIDAASVVIPTACSWFTKL